MPLGRLISYLRVLFGLSLLGGLVWYFDVKSIVRPLADMEVAWVLGAATLIVVATLIGAFNRHLFVDLEGRIPLAAFLPMYWVAWAIGLVIPGQIGEVAALSAMLKRNGMQWPTSLGRSLLDKFISFSLMLVFGLVGVLHIAKPGIPTGSVPLMVAVPALLFALLVYFVWRGGQLKNFERKKRSAFVDVIIDTAREFMDTSSRFPEKVLLNALLTLLGICVIGTAYWCVFMALGYTELSLWRIVPLVAACSIVAYVPVSFNGIGTVEVTGIVLFGFLGVPAPAVLSAYLCLRLIVFALAWLPAATILVFRPLLLRE